MGKIYDHLELIGPRLLVRPMPDLNTTAGGIILPEATQHTQNRAIVEKVGPGELLEPEHAGGLTNARRPMTVADGDLVLYQKFAGTWVVLDGVTRLMLLEEEIQAFIDHAKFTLIRHDDENEHLEGEPCLICLAPAMAAKEAAAKSELETLRQELVAGSSPSA